MAFLIASCFPDGVRGGSFPDRVMGRGGGAIIMEFKVQRTRGSYEENLNPLLLQWWYEEFSWKCLKTWQHFSPRGQSMWLGTLHKSSGSHFYYVTKKWHAAQYLINWKKWFFFIPSYSCANSLMLDLHWSVCFESPFFYLEITSLNLKTLSCFVFLHLIAAGNRTPA